MPPVALSSILDLHGNSGNVFLVNWIAPQMPLKVSLKAISFKAGIQHVCSYSSVTNENRLHGWALTVLSCDANLIVSPYRLHRKWPWCLAGRSNYSVKRHIIAQTSLGVWMAGWWKGLYPAGVGIYPIGANRDLLGSSPWFTFSINIYR